ncbi:MAG TPA: glycerophosphoryl diester phosphodiesterase membrane domain-containing protein [Solirubrobacterales bacterium]|jgi:hypothetical protein|nr:glycerophosphoryl diester phosphodiesterase membrane domain-containing protein [Solirubrobacterales bacterium]
MNDTPRPDDANPFQSPAPPLARNGGGEVYAGSPFASRASPAGGSNFGGQLNRAFNAYTSQWSAWLVPVLLSGLIAVGCYVACVIPYLLAQGPLACGLYMCAFRNLRGWPVESSDLNRGWEELASAMWAGLAMLLLQMAPALLFALIAVPGLLLFASAGGPGQMEPNQRGGLFLMGFFALEIVFIFAMIIWSFWINARTMFVMPLIADRGYNFSTALGESWRVTRVRFWERVLISFLAMLIGMLGMYACYVGILFTLPLYFLIISAAYDDEFGIQSIPGGLAQPR